MKLLSSNKILYIGAILLTLAMPTISKGANVEWNTLAIEKFSGGYYCTAWPLDLVSYGSGDTVNLL